MTTRTTFFFLFPTLDLEEPFSGAIPGEMTDLITVVTPARSSSAPERLRPISLFSFALLLFLLLFLLGVIFCQRKGKLPLLEPTGCTRAFLDRDMLYLLHMGHTFHHYLRQVSNTVISSGYRPIVLLFVKGPQTKLNSPRHISFIIFLYSFSLDLPWTSRPCILVRSTNLPLLPDYRCCPRLTGQTALNLSLLPDTISLFMKLSKLPVFHCY